MEDDTSGNRIVIYQSAEVSKFAMQYFSHVDGRTTHLFNDKIKRLESNDISYRVINHWEKEGLLNIDRPNGTGWRTYSLMDLLWAQTILELRSFGYPIEKLRMVMNDLQGPGDYEWDGYLTWPNKMPWLEVYFVMAYIFRYACYLMVTSDGVPMLATHEELLGLQGFGILDANSYIRVSLNKVLQSVTKKDVMPQFEWKKSSDLSAKEIKILEMIRNDEFSSILLKKKDGVVFTAVGTKNVQLNQKIEELLRNHEYQTIEIHQESGKKVRITQSVKIKL